MSNVLEKYKILLDKDYVLSLLDEYLKSNLSDEDVFSCTTIDTSETNLANGKFFTSLVAHDYKGEDKRALAAGLISDPERITYRSWDILGTKEDQNIRYFFNISIPNNEKETLLYAIYSICKKRGIPFQISNLKPSLMGKGRRDVIQVSTSLENFDNIYNALLSVSNLYTRKCSTPSLLTQPVSEWLAFDALSDDGRKVSDIIKSTFLDCLHIYGDDKQVVASALEDEKVRDEFVNAVLVNLQNNLANVATITFKTASEKEYEVKVDPVKVEYANLELTQQLHSLTEDVLSMLNELKDNNDEKEVTSTENVDLVPEEISQAPDEPIATIGEESDIFEGSLNVEEPSDRVEEVFEEHVEQDSEEVAQQASAEEVSQPVPVEETVPESDINFKAPSLDLLSSDKIVDAIDFGSTAIIPVSAVKDVLEAEAEAAVKTADVTEAATMAVADAVVANASEVVTNVNPVTAETEIVEEVAQQEAEEVNEVVDETESALNNLLYAGMDEEPKKVESKDDDWLNGAFNLDAVDDEVEQPVFTQSNEYTENKTEVLDLEDVSAALSEQTTVTEEAPVEEVAQQAPVEVQEKAFAQEEQHAPEFDINNVFGINETQPTEAPEQVVEAEQKEVEYNFEPRVEEETETVKDDNPLNYVPEETTQIPVVSDDSLPYVEAKAETNDFAGMEVVDANLTDSQREVLVQTANNAQNAQVNESISKYNEISTDPSFFGLQINLPNGEVMSVLDYFETNNILNKIPLNANVYTAEGVVMKGSQFIYKIVTDGLISQYDSLDTIIDTFSSKISVEEQKKKSRGLFGLFGKAA